MFKRRPGVQHSKSMHLRQQKIQAPNTKFANSISTFAKSTLKSNVQFLVLGSYETSRAPCLANVDKDVLSDEFSPGKDWPPPALRARFQLDWVWGSMFTQNTYFGWDSFGKHCKCHKLRTGTCCLQYFAFFSVEMEKYRFYKFDVEQCIDDNPGIDLFVKNAHSTKLLIYAGRTFRIKNQESPMKMCLLI